MGIVLFDLTGMDRVPGTFAEAQELGLRQLSRTDMTDVHGTYRPWDYIVIDTGVGLRQNLDFYESFLRSGAHPRLIVLLDELQFADDSSSQQLQVPVVFESNSDRVRLIGMTSRTGCLWKIREVRPDGLCFWEPDSDGRFNRDVLIEALRIPEVFNSVFENTNASTELWSVGTKQAWFGSLNQTALKDGFYDVGQQLVGDDAYLSMLKNLGGWRDDVSIELLGGQSEADLVSKEGLINDWYERIRRTHSQCFDVFGLRSRRRGVIKRVAKYPGLQTAGLEAMSSAIADVDDELLRMITEVNPSDGWQYSEISRLGELGVVLSRDDTTRQTSYQDSAQALLEQVINKMEQSLGAGYSLGSVRHELVMLNQIVEPRNVEEILKGRRLDKPPQFLKMTSGGYEAISLKRLGERLSQGSTKVPIGPLLLIAKATAAFLSAMWRRVFAAVLYFWLLLMVLFEQFEIARGVPTLLPVPETVQSSARSVVTIIFLIASGVIVLGGLSLQRAASRIQRWGNDAGLSVIGRAVEENRNFINQMIMNDWILYPFRRKASDFLGGLITSVDRLIDLVSDLLVNTTDESQDASVVIPGPNPAVRKMGDELSNSAWYRQMDSIKDLLRTEIVQLIRHQYVVRTPEFKTKRWREVAESMVEDLRPRIDDYVARIARTGVLHIDPAMVDEDVERRRDLAQEYWRNLEEIRRQLEEVVSVDSRDAMVQFCYSDDIRRIEQSDGQVVIVRFAPEPSRTLLAEKSTVFSEVTFTNTTELAGVVRLIPFRHGLVNYWDPNIHDRADLN
jgi:hypothetical protein